MSDFLKAKSVLRAVFLRLYVVIKYMMYCIIVDIDVVYLKEKFLK